MQTPEPGKCLFYTHGLSESAQKYSRRHQGMFRTIWVSRCISPPPLTVPNASLFAQDIWPCNLYRGTNTTDNPLRCIFKNESQRTIYFENMSRAMAMLCDVLATVMTKDVDHLPKGGIWGRVEDETLKMGDNPGGVVNKVITSQQPATLIL